MESFNTKSTTKHLDKSSAPTTREELLAPQEKMASKFRTIYPKEVPEKVPTPHEPKFLFKVMPTEFEMVAEFENAKVEYQKKKKKAGNLTIEDEIDFVHLESKHIAQKRKAVPDPEYNPKSKKSEQSKPLTGEELRNMIAMIPGEYQAPNALECDPELKPENEVAEFEKVKTLYNKKKSAGAVTIEDEIEFMRAESKHMAQTRKANADTEFDRSSSDFEDSEVSQLLAGIMKKFKKPTKLSTAVSTKSESSEFEKAKQEYQIKKEAGKITTKDELKFMRLESKHTAQKRKADAGAKSDRSTSTVKNGEDLKPSVIDPFKSKDIKPKEIKSKELRSKEFTNIITTDATKNSLSADCTLISHLEAIVPSEKLDDWEDVTLDQKGDAILRSFNSDVSDGKGFNLEKKVEMPKKIRDGWMVVRLADKARKGEKICKQEVVGTPKKDGI